MPQEFIDIETKEDDAQKLAALVGIPSKFTYSAEEWNLIRDRINQLHSLIANASGGNLAQNNLVREKYVFIDFPNTSDLLQELATTVNGFPQFEVGAEDHFYFYAYRYLQGNPTIFPPLLSVQRFVWKLKIGKGTYGENGTPLTKYDFQFKGAINETEYNTVNYDLGEIGTTAINDAVDSSGAYSIPMAVNVKFKAARNGEEHTYLYVGESDRLIGTGQPATDVTDYIDLNGEVPDETGDNYVTQDQFRAALYGELTYIEAVSRTSIDFSSQAEKYLIYVSGEDKFYFASEQTNIEDFNQTRIYLAANGRQQRLGAPDYSQDGYDLYHCPNFNTQNTQLELNEVYRFDFWRLTGGQEAVIKKDENGGLYIGGYAPTTLGNIGIDFTYDLGSATGSGSMATTKGQATGNYSSADSGGHAGASGAHADSSGTAYGKDGHADSRGEQNGDYGSASGRGVVSNSFSERAVGVFNKIVTEISKTAWQAADLVFSIGIGKSDTERANGLEVYKNGKVKAPQMKLDQITDPQDLTTRDFVVAKIIELTQNTDLAATHNLNNLLIQNSGVIITIPENLDFDECYFDAQTGFDYALSAGTNVTIEAPQGLSRSENEQAVLYQYEPNKYRFV